MATGGKPSLLPAWLLASQSSLQNAEQNMVEFEDSMQQLNKKLAAFDELVAKATQRPAPPPPPPPPAMLTFSNTASLDIVELLFAMMGTRATLAFGAVNRSTREVVKQDGCWRRYAVLRWKWPIDTLPVKGWRQFCVHREKQLTSTLVAFRKMQSWKSSKQETSRDISRLRDGLIAMLAILAVPEDHISRAQLLENYGVRNLLTLLQDKSAVIQELAASCVANLLCGQEAVHVSVKRYSMDRTLHTLLASPTAVAQSLAAKHAARALCNLYFSWCVIVSRRHEIELEHAALLGRRAREQLLGPSITTPTSPSPAMVPPAAAAVIDACSDDTGASGSGAGEGVGAGAALDMVKLEVEGEAVPSPASPAIAALGLGEDWLGVADQWHPWHVMYVTKSGRCKEKLTAEICLRSNGVMVGRGTDIDGGPFVLTGVYKAPTHTVKQVTFEFSKRYVNIGYQGAEGVHALPDILAESGFETHAAIDGHVGHIGYSQSLFEGMWGVWEVTSSRTPHFELRHGGVFRMFPTFCGYDIPWGTTEATASEEELL